MTFSEHLLELRKKSGCSQQNMADSLEISLRAYRYYESGEREPQLSVLIRMADYFGLSLDELVGRER